MQNRLKIAPNSILFLDRDGVINYEKEGDYIYNIQEFNFIPGAKEAIKICNKYFDKILVVSNQRGIGKGLMTEADLMAINTFIQNELNTIGAQIHKFYHCPQIEDSSDCRKPNIGMALQAYRDFDISDSVSKYMVGNALSDMKFAKNINATAIYITDTAKPYEIANENVDFSFSNLFAFAQAIDL